jgi:thioredoxin-like negative regulator of GroEL
MSTEVAEATEVVAGKSKSRRHIAWSVLAIVVAFLAYNNFDSFKPVAGEAYDSVKSGLSSVLPASTSTASAAESLDKARLAFSHGDVQAAQAAYKETIARDSSNLDAHGELGNLYLLTGNTRDAAQSYYDLSKLLLDQKRFDLVPSLLPVIAQVNPSLVEELMDKMAEVQRQTFEAQVAQQSRRG